ncbi:5850_t:CDS:2 [Entrophospora sp. SA101]|nr:5850_t:CDS:2 [Entrophospora sp. SA101]
MSWFFIGKSLIGIKFRQWEEFEVELPLGYIICYDPSTGQYLGKTRAHTDQDVQEALRKAQKAQNKWSKTSFAERNKFLNSLLNFIIKNQQEICWVSSRDTGKTLVDAEFGEILTTCERIRWTIENGEKELAPQYHDPSPILPYKIAKIVYQPFALYSGNGILVKASEQVAWSMKYYENIIKTCLIACGHDPDIVQFLCGFAECGEAIVKSGVDGVTFIGSSEVGKKVMKTASYNLTPCILELGGKDCAIIRHDTNLNAAIPIIMRGTFQNSGQNCVGIERVLIHESLHDEFIKKVTKQIELMRIGSALNDNDQFTVDVGALTMSGQAERLKSIVRTSINEGAKLMAGGDIYTHPKYPTSQYFQPTLITDVTKEMSIVQHELFGPIMVVMKFSTDEEAIEICNSSPYGLGNSIFTQNTPIAEEMSYRLRCGMVNINDFGSSYLSNLPFGGVGISGFGKFGGAEGIRSLCLKKSITLDKYPKFITTTIPRVVNYPLSTNSSIFVSSLVKTIYEIKISDKVKGLVALLRNFLGY